MLVAIFKSLSGTINVCRDECPINCNLLIIFYVNLDEPNKLKICINPLYIKVKAFDDYKGWEDGTYAVSCERYKYPPRFYYYEGDDVYNNCININ